jgi:hypothetical protein
MDAEAAELWDWQITFSEAGGATGRVIILGRGQVVDMTFDDVPRQASTTGGTNVTIRPGSSLLRIELPANGADVRDAKPRETGRVRAVFSDGSIDLPIGDRRGFSTSELIDALRRVAGWAT